MAGYLKNTEFLDSGEIPTSMQYRDAMYELLARAKARYRMNFSKKRAEKDPKSEFNYQIGKLDTKLFFLDEIIRLSEGLQTIAFDEPGTEVLMAMIDQKIREANHYKEEYSKEKEKFIKNFKEKYPGVV